MAIFFCEVLNTPLSPQCFYAADYTHLTNGDEPSSIICPKSEQ